MAGGSTPAATYAELKTRGVQWNRVYAWVGDERFVPPDHPENNGTMIGRSLIDDTDATLFRVPWNDEASPDELAAEYESTLIEIMDHDDTGPLPNLLLAGIGDDGHTLSLFPDTAALEENTRWFVANHVPQMDTWRLTTTYPLAWRAEQIFVLVSGIGKARTLAEILSPTSDQSLPARRLMKSQNKVTWLVDRDAASLLEEPS